MACCGDVPTLETLAAVELLRRHLPELKVRVVNVVDLMKLQPASEHPHGLSDPDFDALFTKDKPVIFAFHGYPWLIHRLTYRRTNHKNIHVRGYKEEGTTTTPFDMVVLNDLDRFHLAGDVIDRLPQLGRRAAYFKQAIQREADRPQAVHRPATATTCPAISGWRGGLRGAGRRRPPPRPKGTTSRHAPKLPVRDRDTATWPAELTAPRSCDHRHPAGDRPGLIRAARRTRRRTGSAGGTTGARPAARPGREVDLPFEQDVNAFVSEVFEHRTFFSRLHHFVLGRPTPSSSLPAGSARSWRR